MVKVNLVDILFVIVVISLSALTITFLWTAVRSGYRKAMIESMQTMTASQRFDDSTEIIELEEIASNQGRKPYIGMYKVHMLAPNVAQYGYQNATYIPTIAGIPMSAFPDIDMRKPWALADIEAAEVPEKEGCRKSATGLFHECGVLPSNTCE